jgi:hypothetical protein
MKNVSALWLLKTDDEKCFGYQVGNKVSATLCLGQYGYRLSKPWLHFFHFTTFIHSTIAGVGGK